MPPLGTPELDKLFCLFGKKYGLPKLVLKAIGIRESSLMQGAYRFEPNFWERYCKNNPKWKDKDPAQVSASWGIMQLMYVVASELGFEGTGEELCNPVINIELGAKLLRLHLDEVIKDKIVEKFIWLSPLQIICCRYNGGEGGNPNDKGILRKQTYYDGVKREWDELKKKESECDEL